MRQSIRRNVTLRVTVTGFDAFSTYETSPDGSGIGLLARWRDDEDGVDLDALVHARLGRAAYVDLSGLLPGDEIAVAGIATLIEVPPTLKPTVVLDASAVRLLNRAPQSWQRGTTA